MAVASAKRHTDVRAVKLRMSIISALRSTRINILNPLPDNRDAGGPSNGSDVRMRRRRIDMRQRITRSPFAHRDPSETCGTNCGTPPRVEHFEFSSNALTSDPLPQEQGITVNLIGANRACLT